MVGDPLDETTDVSALISPSERDRVKDVDRRGGHRRRQVVTGGELDDDGVLRPTVLTDATPDMKVCRKEVFGPVVGDPGLRRPRRRARAGQRHRVRPAGRDLHAEPQRPRSRAVRTLDFGGVLVNEVPTWRADQMPYGGVRDQRQHP